MAYRSLRKFKQEQREYEFKRANQAIWDMFKPEPEQNDEPEYSPEDEWESGFSDWKHNKDDDLATAVRRYAMPMRRVRIWDEVEVGR